MASDPIQLVAAYKIIKYMTTPFEEWDAYKLGLIDKNGNKIKKAKTNEERDALPPLARVALNLRRLLAKVPGGNSKFASIAAAMFLLKEKYEIGDGIIEFVLKETGNEIEMNENSEELNGTQFIGNKVIRTYKKTNETFLGFPVYEGTDLISGKKIKFIGETNEEII